MNTLTIIETPTSTAFQINEPASDEDADTFRDTPAANDSAALLFHENKSLDKSPPVEPELLIVRARPITSTIRSTMKHLRAQAGRWSGFRGIASAVVYGLLEVVLSTFLASLGSFILPFTILRFFLAAIVTNVALAGLDMTWTHIVISAPSTRPWWQRIPSLSRVKRIIVPTAIYTFLELTSRYTPQLLFMAFIFKPDSQDPSSVEYAMLEIRKNVITSWVIIHIVQLILYIFIVFPALITLRRVQASMLPDEDEAIVPFDRTFNGKVQPVVAGGSGAISMRDAWKTFDWSATVRFYKLQAKVFLLTIATSIMFIAMLEGEILMFKTGGKPVENPNPAI